MGDIVTCKVQRINPRLATVEILCVGDVPLAEACAGLIRREDIRPVGSDPVEVYRSFRPMDIVMARVLSLGDARAYYLTSSEVHLGVVHARSQSERAVMTPIAHNEMMCPVSKARESRKVAKPRDQPTAQDEAQKAEPPAPPAGAGADAADAQQPPKKKARGKKK